MALRHHIPRARLVLLAMLALMLTGTAPASAGVRHFKLRIGPKTLGGYEVRQNTDWVEAPNVEGYITRMRAHVVDKRGRDIPIQRIMLHHVLFVNRGVKDGDRHDGSCPGLPRERIFGTGEEHQTLRLPDGYGIPIHKKERWTAAWMLMNHKLKRDSAYIEYDVTVETKKRLTPVKAYWLDVTKCRGHVYYNVPGGGAPGSTAYKTMIWRPPFDGRIVAGGAHLHGAAKTMKLIEEDCQDREIFGSRPLYGLDDDAVYKVRPVLHEPGPINTSWLLTEQGIPVHQGEPIRVSGEYDAERPHVKVMSVMHIYMARAKNVPAGCAPMPTDVHNDNIGVPGRLQAPVVQVNLTGLTAEGKTVTIDRPEGADEVFDGSANVLVHDYSFDKPNLSIPLGASITWRFPDSTAHDVTLANGPFGFSSPFSRRGRTYTQQFTRPGTYRLFCSLHPVVMHEAVDVREGEASPAQPAAKRSGAGGGAPQPVVHW
jgi:plastocyanin